MRVTSRLERYLESRRRIVDGALARALHRTGAAGAGGMVGGQALDLAAEGSARRRGATARLREIHLRKTAALISGALEAGAIAGGADRAQAAALAAYGRRLGLAFQITDDVLDV